MSIVYPPVGSTGSEKIDNKATLGLLGTANSLAYRVHEIARHLHSGAAWFEEAGTPSATHFADRIGTSGGGGAFRIDAGNNDWGSWVQILGSDDTPVRSGMVYFDPHLILVTDTENADLYFVQIARGASGEAAFTAGMYTEFIYNATVRKDTAIIPVQTGRAPAGSLLWCRTWCVGSNTGTISFMMGIHEYEG